MEAAQIVEREGLDFGGAAAGGCAVAMFVAEDDPRKRHLHDRRRIVARLQEPGQALLAQPLELRGRKRRPQRHVGHERQRVSELRDRHGEADR